MEAKNKTTTDSPFPTPWTVDDFAPEDIPPARREASVFAADSTRLFMTRGPLAGALARKVVDAVNNAEGVRVEPPQNPTRDQIMFHLERMIHQYEDDEGRELYHPNSLWLEEVRHHIKSVEQQLATAKEDFIQAEMARDTNSELYERALRERDRLAEVVKSRDADRVYWDQKWNELRDQRDESRELLAKALSRGDAAVEDANKARYALEWSDIQDKRDLVRQINEAREQLSELTKLGAREMHSLEKKLREAEHQRARLAEAIRAWRCKSRESCRCDYGHDGRMPLQGDKCEKCKLWDAVNAALAAVKETVRPQCTSE